MRRPNRGCEHVRIYSRQRRGYGFPTSESSSDTWLRCDQGGKQSQSREGDNDPKGEKITGAGHNQRKRPQLPEGGQFLRWFNVTVVAPT